MNRQQWAEFQKKYLKKKQLQRARVRLKQLEATYAQRPMWAEQWMEIAQIFLKGASLALQCSEAAPSYHDDLGGRG
jgi:hypothetical protein